MPSVRARLTHFKEDDVLSVTPQAAERAATRGQMMATPKPLASEELLEFILKLLSDEKAEDIVQIDLHGKSAIGDYMVICSGRSTRQVTALAEKLSDELKQRFGRLSKIEGKTAGDWVLIDTGDVVVHIFRPEVREFYQLEKMWMPTGAEASRA